MTEIVFAPDSGAGFIVWFGLVVVVIAGGLVVAIARSENVDPKAFGLPGVFLLMGGTLLYLGLTDASSVSFEPGRVLLHYHWPRSTVVVPLDEIREARTEMRGTKRPSPRLVIELRDGTTYEGEGTSHGENVRAAADAIRRLLHSSHRD